LAKFIYKCVQVCCGLNAASARLSVDARVFPRPASLYAVTLHVSVDSVRERVL